MLIIRRKAGEAILVGADTEIEVVEISASRVKLGFTAPAHVLILRKEIQLARQQNLAAARSVTPQAIASVVSRLRDTLHTRR